MWVYSVQILRNLHSPLLIRSLSVASFKKAFSVPFSSSHFFFLSFWNTSDLHYELFNSYQSSTDFPEIIATLVTSKQ